MKHSVITAAVFATASVAPLLASAQSSVTLFGIVDATLAFGRGSISNRTQLTNSGYNSSRVGFRGTEDLGGGMSAAFWLEAGVNNDDGQGAATNQNNQASGAGPAVAGRQGLTFNRRSTVSLAGGWGEVRVGRDFTPQFWNVAVFDPFGLNGVGLTQTFNSIITGVTAVRASNSLGYFLPANLGGLYGQLQHYRGENPSGAVTSKDGNGNGMRIGFSSGAFNVALGLSKTEYAAGDVKQNNVGGEWNFGVAKLQAHYSRDSNGALNGKGYLIGGVAPVGVGEFRIAYSRYRTDLAGNPTTKKVAIGYVHNLSKRTALYATYARLKNSGGATQSLNGAVTAPNASSSGYDLGIRHAF